MSIKEFMDKFLNEPIPVEVHLNNGLIYVGSPANWGAFKTHMKGFTNTVIDSVSVRDGKLIVNALLE